MNSQYSEDFNQYNRKICNLAISKENVKRVFISSFGLIIINAILIAVSFAVRDNGVLLPGFKIAAGLVACVSAAFFLLTRSVLRQKTKEYYNIVNMSYWTFVAASGVIFSFFISLDYLAAIPLVIAAGSSCLIPLLKKEEILFIILCHAIAPVIALVFLRIASYMIVYNLMVVALSAVVLIIRYENFRHNFNYKTKLNVAIRQSERDKLTGLLNRRGLERGIFGSWENWVLEGQSLAVIMLDIDFFKKYNDAFGHKQGDYCIQAVANQISSAIRKNSDYAARVGGEEFFICLSGINEKDAIEWAKRLKKSVEDLKLVQSKENFLPYVTVSMGMVLAVPSRSTQFDSLYKSADEQLYEAKKNGRACLMYKNKCYDRRLRSDFINKTADDIKYLKYTI